MSDAPTSDDFTEAAYRELVALARQGYRFLSFADAAAADSGVLWRHDIDVSVHRALALARIEHEAGVRATYFVHLHSVFYNAFEPAIVERLRLIASLGHELGLHFDPHFHGCDPARAADLADAVVAEARAIEGLAAIRVAALSFHDPDRHGGTVTEEDVVGGLVSASGRTIRDRFAYCSDSNGYWRFAPLRDELASLRHRRLHALTHPEWWVPEPMSPRDRIRRAIEGRSASVAAGYDDTLASLGRRSVP